MSFIIMYNNATVIDILQSGVTISDVDIYLKIFVCILILYTYQI